MDRRISQDKFITRQEENNMCRVQVLHLLCMNSPLAFWRSWCFLISALPQALALICWRDEFGCWCQGAATVRMFHKKRWARSRRSCGWQQHRQDSATTNQGTALWYPSRATLWQVCGSFSALSGSKRTCQMQGSSESSFGNSKRGCYLSHMPEGHPGDKATSNASLWSHPWSPAVKQHRSQLDWAQAYYTELQGTTANGPWD